MADRSYPSIYTPGPDAHWAVNDAWTIVDNLPSLAEETRPLLAGMIIGMLLKVRNQTIDELTAELKR